MEEKHTLDFGVLPASRKLTIDVGAMEHQAWRDRV
jgi:hypothetical protein